MLFFLRAGGLDFQARYQGRPVQEIVLFNTSFGRNLDL